MFNKLSTDKHQESQDRVGGFTLYDTAVYEAVIKAAYYIKSGSSESSGMHLTLELEGGRIFNTDIYATNGKGENFYIDQQTQKEVSLPGFVLLRDLYTLVTGNNFDDLEWEDRVFDIWSREEGKPVPTSVPTAIELLGEPIRVAIAKKERPAGRYDRDTKTTTYTGEIEHENNVVQFFHLETTLSYNEIIQGKESIDDAKFMAEWADHWTGKVMPLNRKEKQIVADAQKGGAKSGRPGGSAPVAEGTERKKKSGLFSKK